MPPSDAKKATKKSVLQALRLDFRELISIGMLFFVAILSWCIAEGSTTLFREKINSELRTITASDMSVSSQMFPTESDRNTLRELAIKHGAETTESVEFPFTLEEQGTVTNSGNRYTSANIRIVDENYPLYGSVSYSGSFSGGALAE